MRLINKKILSEFVLYGNLHRFIPIFAMQKGIKMKEVKVSQRKEDTQVRLVKPGVYLRRMLDIITLFFLVKFTKKPLRFFGLIGASLFIPGVFLASYLGILRILGAIELANRPLLLLGILLIVFGIQTFSVGLIGELILFSHAKDLKDYVNSGGFKLSLQLNEDADGSGDAPLCFLTRYPKSINFQPGFHHKPVFVS